MNHITDRDSAPGSGSDRGKTENRRLAFRVASTLSLPVALAAGVLALIWCFPRGSQPGPSLTNESEPPGSGIAVKVEFTTIVLPQAFVELAHSTKAGKHLESHDALRRYLESNHLEKAWYAVYCVRISTEWPQHGPRGVFKPI